MADKFGIDSLKAFNTIWNFPLFDTLKNCGKNKKKRIRNLESLNLTSKSYSGFLYPISRPKLTLALTFEFATDLGINQKRNIHNLMN